MSHWQEHHHRHGADEWIGLEVGFFCVFCFVVCLFYFFFDAFSFFFSVWSIRSRSARRRRQKVAPSLKKQIFEYLTTYSYRIVRVSLCWRDDFSQREGAGCPSVFRGLSGPGRRKGPPQPRWLLHPLHLTSRQCQGRLRPRPPAVHAPGPREGHPERVRPSP